MRCFLLAGLLLPGLIGFTQASKKKKAAFPLAVSAGNLQAAPTAATANALSADTTYLSALDFSGTGTASDPVRVKASPFQSWLESLPGYSNDGSKYLASDFTWKTLPKGGGSLMPLSAPLLTATALGSAAVLLGWADVDNETAYLLQRSLDNASWTTVAQLAANNTQYTDNGLLPSTLYHYRIQAVGDNTAYADSPFGSASATTAPTGTGTPPGVLLFDVANGYNVQQHSDGPGNYHSLQASGVAQALKKLPAGVDGVVYFRYLAGSGEWLSLGYTPDNSLHGYERWLGGLVLYGSQAEVQAYGWNGSRTGLGVAAVNNHFYGFRRNGNVTEIVTSADEINWTVLGYANHSAADLYVQVYFQTQEAKIKVFEKNLATY